MKFAVVKGTNIRKAKMEDGRVYAIIGQVKELLEKDIIFQDNTAGNEDKWLCIEKSGSVINEFCSLQEAKNYIQSIDLCLH